MFFSVVFRSMCIRIPFITTDNIEPSNAKECLTKVKDLVSEHRVTLIGYGKKDIVDWLEAINIESLNN